MALIQIEESELAALRQERNDARTKVDEQANQVRDLTSRVETAEAAQKTAETERDAEKAERAKLEEKAQASSLREKRMGSLGTGFLARLGDLSKERLTELAGKVSDEEWDLALREREEMATVKRDAQADGKTPEGSSTSNGSTFESEEVASFLNRIPASSNGASTQSGATSVRQLARAFGKGKTPTGTN